jgi:hypothetical protein
VKTMPSALASSPLSRVVTSVTWFNALRCENTWLLTHSGRAA